MISIFMSGAMLMACLVAGLFFLKFWRATSDCFFGLFALAFFIFALDRLVLVLSGGFNEAHPSVYLIRCLGFLLIITAVIDKNKTRDPSL